jgi:integrase
MAKRRGFGDGSIEMRGDRIRLRYRLNGKKLSKTLPRDTSRSEAQKELRKLLGEVESGDAVDPNKMTLNAWIDNWIVAGAPGRRKKKVGQRTLERYEELLKVHVRPKLGEIKLQRLHPVDIDRLYQELEGKIAPMTAHHVHVTFNSCLSTAERKGLVRANPMRRVEQVPNAGESDHGLALDATDLAKLVAGFKPSALMYAAVAIDAATGMRRNELLALRWTDFDAERKTLKVERALEVTKKFGARFKPPKTARGRRTLVLDDSSVAILLKEKERHQRIRAGVPDGVEIDLSLIRLPADALIFPAMPAPGKDFSFTTPRDPRNFTTEFKRRVQLLSFAGFTFHHLRGTHATLLLDRGVPVHTVAERLGDEPAVLLRNYAKRKRQRGDRPTMDDAVSAVIDALGTGILGG